MDQDANERYGAFKVGSHDNLVTALGLAVQEPPPCADSAPAVGPVTCPAGHRLYTPLVGQLHDYTIDDRPYQETLGYKPFTLFTSLNPDTNGTHRRYQRIVAATAYPA